MVYIKILGHDFKIGNFERKFRPLLERSYWNIWRPYVSARAQPRAWGANDLNDKGTLFISSPLTLPQKKHRDRDKTQFSLTQLNRAKTHFFANFSSQNLLRPAQQHKTEAGKTFDELGSTFFPIKCSNC